MPAQDSHAVGCSAASWRAPDGAPQGLEQERALAHRRCCTPAERMGPMRPRPEGVAEDRGRSAFAWRDGDADGEMLMPMTEAEADAYDRSEATAGNTLTYLTACGLSVAGSAQSALTFAGSGDMGAHSAPGSDKLLRLGSDGHAGERGVLRPGSARRRIGPELEARACEGLPGAPASERAGVQGPASGLVGAACSMHGHMHFGAPWVPTLPAGAPAGADASEAAAGLCLGSPADEALLAGLFGDPEGYGAGFAGAPAQPLAVPSRSAPGCLARAFLACGDPANLGYDPNPNPLDHAAAPAPLELAHGVPGSLPILSACGPWPGLGLGPRSASGIPAGIRGILPLGYAGGAAPEGARRGLAGAPLGLLSLGLSGPALATPELRQSELQLSLGMGLGLQLDLGAWHYGPGEGAGPQGTLLQAPPGGASNGRGAPAVGLWGAMLEGARQAGAGRFPGFGGRPHGFPGGLPKCEPDANDQEPAGQQHEHCTGIAAALLQNVTTGAARLAAHAGDGPRGGASPGGPYPKVSDPDISDPRHPEPARAPERGTRAMRGAHTARVPDQAPAHGGAGGTAPADGAGKAAAAEARSFIGGVECLRVAPWVPGALLVPL